MYEVEAKIKIEEHDPLRRYLEEHAARKLGEQPQRDVYFNAPHRDFAVTDEALRVRYTGESTEVTYKGPKIASNRVKARKEVNICVDSGEAFELLLELLGFTRSFEVYKYRVEYEWMGTTIALDDVEGLGKYIEIEATVGEGNREEAQQRIDYVVKELGIEGPHIPQSYLELLLATR